MYSQRYVLFHLVQVVNMIPLLDLHVVSPMHLCGHQYGSLWPSSQICSGLEPNASCMEIHYRLITQPYTQIVKTVLKYLSTYMSIMVAMICAIITAGTPIAASVAPIAASVTPIATAITTAMVVIDMQITMRVRKSSIYTAQYCSQNQNNLWEFLNWKRSAL